MEAKLISGGCDGGNCPAVYVTDQESVIVQGFNLDNSRPSGVSLSEGESAVEIPVDIWRRAIAGFGEVDGQ